MADRPPPDTTAERVTHDVHPPGGPATFRSHKIRIEVVDGENAGQVFALPGPEVRVGSSTTCDLVLLDATVSRHHFTLQAGERGIRVVDAGSKNGTFLDGLCVVDAWARAGSNILAGKTTLALRLLDDVVELPLSPRDRFGELWGASVAMRRVFAILERVSRSDTTILIEGETGTGKELAAEAIHETSPRAAAPFVVFDCSAVSATLVESELFGHVRGAFTGAVADRVGAVEAAHGGTLFLDEIGELPLDLQPKLLRALERREVRRVGSNTPRKVDVRIVAATNRSLAAEVDAGRFREDLYYRLEVVRVVLPPLRERLDDIPLLVQRFCRDLTRGPAPRLPERTVAHFQEQAWPGNVRELRNAVARTLSLGGQAGPAEPPPPEAAPSPPGEPAVDLSIPLKLARERVAEAFERAYLAAALRQTGGNISQAAELCGVNRKFVQRGIKRYGLRDDE